MLLVVDVGNTHITLGVFDGRELKATFRTTAKQPRTSDEYGIQLCDLLEHKDFDIKEIKDVIVSSVVPDVMHSLGSAIIKYFHVKPIVPSTLDMGLKINTENPKEIGPETVCLREVSSLREFVRQQEPSGAEQPCFRKLKSANRTLSLPKRRYPVCKEALSLDTSDRQNIL